MMAARKADCLVDPKVGLMAAKMAASTADPRVVQTADLMADY
tara:strand:- start:286 stop:411 length:126 start_codon:yes stop_codon:yes gene_type:complete